MSKGRIFLVVIDGLPIKINRKQTSVTFPSYEDFVQHVTMTEIKREDTVSTKHKFITFLIDDGVLDIDHFFSSDKKSFREGKLYCSFYVREVIGATISVDHLIPAQTFNSLPFVTNMENIINVINKGFRDETDRMNSKEED